MKLQSLDIPVCSSSTVHVIIPQNYPSTPRSPLPMKPITPRFLLLVCATLIGTLSTVYSSRADTFLMLNFSLGDPTTNTPANARTIPGFSNVTAPFVGTSANASISNIAGTKASFTINNVSSYDTGVNTEPLTTTRLPWRAWQQARRSPCTRCPPGTATAAVESSLSAPA